MLQICEGLFFLILIFESMAVLVLSVQQRNSGIYMHVFVCVWESKDIPLKKWCLSQDLKEVDEQSRQFNLASLSVLLLQNKTEILFFDLSFSYYLMVACQRYNSNFKRR